jgi:single-stranded DNA-binding protein
MSSYVLVSGSLFRVAEQKTSKVGRAFTTATIKTRDGETSQWWKVVAFSESAQAELLRLCDGDAVACQGPLKVETYAKDGETKVALSIIANNVLALRKPQKQHSSSRHEECAPAPESRFNDSYEALR